jgi:hypothetical protein
MVLPAGYDAAAERQVLSKQPHDEERTVLPERVDRGKERRVLPAGYDVDKGRVLP